MPSQLLFLTSWRVQTQSHVATRLWTSPKRSNSGSQGVRWAAGTREEGAFLPLSLKTAVLTAFKKLATIKIPLSRRLGARGRGHWGARPLPGATRCGAAGPAGWGRVAAVSDRPREREPGAGLFTGSDILCNSQYSPKPHYHLLMRPLYSVTCNRSISLRKSLFNADYFICSHNYISFG